MSMIDAQALLSDSQAVPSSANGTNTYDTGTPVRDVGAGSDLYLNVQVTEAFVGPGVTLSISLVAADDALLTSNVNTLAQSGTYAAASLIPGWQYSQVVPRNAARPRGQRYLGIKYVVAGGSFSAGKVTAWLGEPGVSDFATLYQKAAVPVV